MLRNWNLKVTKPDPLDIFDAFVDLLNTLCVRGDWETVDGFFTSTNHYSVFESLVLLHLTALAKEFLPSREQFSIQFYLENPSCK